MNKIETRSEKLGHKRAISAREQYRLRRQLCAYRSLMKPQREADDTSAQELIAMEQRLNQVNTEAENLRELALRQKAEFENFRKRTQRDKDQIRIAAKEDVVSKLLTVMDNFDRALASTQQATDASAIREGVQMVASQLHRILGEEGLQKMDALNQPFDPNEHEAVAVEDRDDMPNGHVCEVMLPGYRLNERVIRPAMVKVCKKSEQDQESPAGAPAEQGD